jgi:copper chaperone NosL
MKNNQKTGMSHRQRLFISLSILFIALFIIGCSKSANLDEPPEILYGQDVCDQCNMIINEERFAAAYTTEAGEVRRFDDIGGMLVYDHKHQEKVHIFWVHDLNSAEWINVSEAHFVVSDELMTPMGWGVAAFASQEQAATYVAANGGVLADFGTLQQAIADGTLDPTTLSNHQHESGMEMDHDMNMGDE